MSTVIEIPHAIVPYQRMTKQGRFTARAKRYHASQNMLAAELQAGLRAVGVFACIDYPVRIGVEIAFPPVASGPRRGGLPANRGDWDNYFKAVCDALVSHRLLERDDVSLVRGPGRRSGVILGEREGVVVTFERVEETTTEGES